MRRGVEISSSENEGVIILSGVIDAHTDLSSLLEESQEHLILNLNGIKETNSVGVKKWVENIQALQQKGKTIEYQECSPSFVRQCNFVPEIYEGVKIQSFHVMFECEECDEFQLKMMEMKELDMDNLPPEIPCSSCGEPMETEDVVVFDFIENGA